MSMQGAEVSAAGGVHALSPWAPPILPDFPGCISSMHQALRGGGEDPKKLLENGEFITTTETAILRLQSEPSQRWGVLLAQLACPTIATDWPLGSTAHTWGEADGTVTWLLAAGAGEGDEHVEFHVPPSQRAVWRPLGLIRAAKVEMYLRDPGCAVQYVYKGTRHPSAAERCVGRPTDEEPMLVRPAPSSWYTPPDVDGIRFTDTATIRWLTTYAFSSRSSHAVLINSDSPWFPGGYNSGPHEEGRIESAEGWHGPDSYLTTASECIHGRCASSFAACYREPSCQQAWDAFTSHQGKVPWNQTTMDSFVLSGDRIGSSIVALDVRPQLRALVGCYMSQCTCQAPGDDLSHAFRFTGSKGLSGDEIASIFELANKIGGATRRAFGLSEGGLTSPSGLFSSPSPEAPAAGETRARPKVAQGHRVTYLHGAFSRELPALHGKLLDCAHEAHNKSGWNVIDVPRLTVRTIELLDYEHASDSLGWHVDEQSAVTMLVMLTEPSEFEGALLQHEVRGRSGPVTSTMTLGDVTVYRSHQAHRVTPLVSGRRKVMAIELWHDLDGSDVVFEQDSGTGEPTAARGRPHRRYGQCPA